MAKIGTGAAEGKRTAYINANVLDGTEGMETLENHAVVVEGRRIVDVTPLADADCLDARPLTSRVPIYFQAS